MYSAIDLAKYIVTKCTSENEPISNLQLQKILYYIQREFLQMQNVPAFRDEIEAWQFGPVVPTVYYRFCGSGAMPIKNSFENIPIKSYDKSCIDKIVEEKRRLSPWSLVEDTHKSDGAWAQVYRNGAGNHKPISTDLIKTVG